MDKDYSRFEIEDFAFDESFRRWVSGKDSSVRVFWESYLESNPHQTDVILAARQLVLDLQNESPLTDDSTLVESIWDNVQERTQPKQKVFWLQNSRWYMAAAAVSMLIVVSASVWWLRHSPKQVSLSSPLSSQQDSTLYTERVNTQQKTMTLYLEDGSLVTLEKNSRLIYPKKFGPSSRIVHLSGKAFFDITRNPDRPFLIYANETVTKVLGTSFTISAYQHDNEVIVAVKSGKVSVFPKKDFDKSPQNNVAAGVVLTPNQQAVFSRKQEQFNKTLVEQPILLTSKESNMFDFDNKPLAEVFGVLEKAYGVEIVYDADLVVNRSLKVSFDDESLQEKLMIICNTMDMSYQIVDAKVLIEKKK